MVRDKLSVKSEAKIREKYEGYQVRLVGALWFYLSIYFGIKLPVECFDPAAQRNYREKQE